MFWFFFDQIFGFFICLNIFPLVENIEVYLVVKTVVDRSEVHFILVGLLKVIAEVRAHDGVLDAVRLSHVLSHLHQPRARHRALLETAFEVINLLMEGQNVSLQQLGELEGFAAIFTLELLIAVSEHVFVKGLGVLEDFLALVTHVVVLLAVDLHVDVKGVSVSESFATNMTSLQPFSCVKPHVVFEFLLLAEDDITDGTGLPLLPCVGPLVGVAGALVTKRHLAEITFVRLYTQVNPDVSKQLKVNRGNIKIIS